MTYDPHAAIDAQEWGPTSARRAIARGHKLTSYPDKCEIHGIQYFSTASGKCPLCGDYPAQCHKHGVQTHDVVTGFCHSCRDERATVRSLARRAGDKTYPQPCFTCSQVTDHSVLRGKCLRCFTTMGVPRTVLKLPSARSLARADGRTQYTHLCDVHGLTPHSVKFGKCLQCCTALGVTRAPPRLVSARAAARRDGKAAYIAPCAPCGVMTDHSVQRGKCLTCFNTSGAPRPAKPVRPSYADALQSPRALAKRDGHATYLTRCAHHGVTLHDTQTGECLTCWALDAAMTAP